MQWSKEFKEAVKEECERQGYKATAVSASSLLDILTEGVCKEYLNSISKAAEEQNAKLIEAKCELEAERIAIIRKLNSANQEIEKLRSEKEKTSEMEKCFPRDMVALCNMFSRLTEIAKDAKSSSDVAVTEAAYIMWAYLIGDKETAKSEAKNELKEYCSKYEKGTEIANDDEWVENPFNTRKEKKRRL